MRIQLMAMSGAAALALLGSGCASPDFKAGRLGAVCQVAPLDGGKVSGTVSFTQEEGDVLVEARLDGLSPGKHGIHIHEFGDCGGVSGAAAGGHFNPTGQPHGMAAMQDSHEGDLGNIVADDTGHASLTLKDKWLHFNGPEGILGHSIVVHAGADDLSTQPAGDSGTRIGCGLIVQAPR